MEPELKKLDYWFGVRRGEIGGSRGGSSRTGLLIVDRSGVYSTARRRYIRKTRYHRYRSLAMDLTPLVKAYRWLQKLGMNSWAEHDEGARKETTRLKHRVMDAYWDAAPEKRKGSAMERYFRARYKHGMIYPLLASEVSVLVGAGLWQRMLLGRFNVSFHVLLLHLAFCLVSWFVVVQTERLIKARWSLSRSQIHSVLEFELRN